MKHSISGSVTVFLALTFMLIAALLLAITESARTVSQRLYLQVAMNSSMDSLFSQYHRPLWEKYRILGLEYRDDADLSKELSEFMAYYTDSEDLFPMHVDEENIEFSDHTHITDDISFEEEILEYMKYGMVDSFIRFAMKDHSKEALGDTLKDQFKRIPEAENISKLQKEYQLNSHSLEAVEDAIGAVSMSVSTVREQHEFAGRELQHENPGSFLDRSSDFRYCLSRVKDSVDSYIAAADKLSMEVAALRNNFEGKKAELSEEGIAAINAEISEYESYIDASGPVRSQIEGLVTAADSLAASSERVDSDVEDFEEWLSEAISDYEDSADEDDDDYDFSYEISQFYQGAFSDWSSFPMISFDNPGAQINKSNKRILESITSLLDGDMLAFVLPEGSNVPSHDVINEADPGFPANSSANLIDLAVIGEYSLHFFNYYRNKDIPDDDKPKSKSTALEIEYLLGGEANDYDNLSELVLKLVALREGMNIIYLYSDAEKLQEAHSFVMASLLGGAAVASPALLPILTFFVLGIWALAQAISDVKLLLSGGRVPIIHDRSSFSMDISMLLDFGKSHHTSVNTENTKGLSYRDYLRVFLFGEGMLDQSEINCRMLSRIEKNLRIGAKGEPQFLIDQCLYAVSGSAMVDARHVMYQVGILNSVAGHRLEPKYSFTASSYYKYKNDTQ